MNKRFDDLTAVALHLADDTLLHIAETEHCTDEQTARITQLAKQKAGFVQKSAKPIRHKKRVRALGVLIAAAVAAVGATVGVSAYINRNNDMLNNIFGVGGAEQVSLAELPAPVQYANENACITVETVLNDGIRAWVLLSGTLPDGTLYDWHVPSRTVYEDGTTAFKTYNGSGFDFVEDRDANQEEHSGTRPWAKYWVYEFELSEFAEDEPIYLAFQPYDDTEENPLEGIRIPLNDMLDAQNTPTATFTSESGAQIQLSDFEIVYDMPKDDTDEGISFPLFCLITNDGARHTLHSRDGASRPIQTEDGTEMERYFMSIVIPQDEADWADVDFTQPILPNIVGDADKTISLIDVTTVKAIEMDGTLYTRAD